MFLGTSGILGVAPPSAKRLGGPRPTGGYVRLRTPVRGGCMCGCENTTNYNISPTSQLIAFNNLYCKVSFM
jgi:hypothetical protein